MSTEPCSTGSHVEPESNTQSRGNRVQSGQKTPYPTSPSFFIGGPDRQNSLARHAQRAGYFDKELAESSPQAALLFAAILAANKIDLSRSSAVGACSQGDGGSMGTRVWVGFLARLFQAVFLCVYFFKSGFQAFLGRFKCSFGRLVSSGFVCVCVCVRACVLVNAGVRACVVCVCVGVCARARARVFYFCC